MTNVAVLGAGAFGTAVAIHSDSLGHRVRVWAFDEVLPEAVASPPRALPYAT
jgi:glycerol-3-phosphate dehydrogenase